MTVSISGVAKSYGKVRAVRGIDLTIPAGGGTIALLGPNGAGKSTTIGMLAGLVVPDDGTVTVCGVRFEVPSAYRTLVQLRLRVARWDLASVDLVDPRSGQHLATLLPLDKARNAERVRRVLSPDAPPASPSGIAPHLRALMADYAATGLPPAFVPKDETSADPNDDPMEQS